MLRLHRIKCKTGRVSAFRIAVTTFIIVISLPATLYTRTNKNKLLTLGDVHCKRILELSVKKRITVEKNYFPKSAPFCLLLSSYY